MQANSRRTDLSIFLGTSERRKTKSFSPSLLSEWYPSLPFSLTRILRKSQSRLTFLSRSRMQHWRTAQFLFLASSFFSETSSHLHRQLHAASALAILGAFILLDQSSESRKPGQGSENEHCKTQKQKTRVSQATFTARLILDIYEGNEYR